MLYADSGARFSIETRGGPRCAFQADGRWGRWSLRFSPRAPALADEIHLKGGGRVSGRIVERTATRVAIETGPGRVTLPLSRVERIVEGRSALEVFAERAAELDAGDAEGWAELARWAEERDLLTQARVAWQRVLATDPAHPEANAGARPGRRSTARG